MTLTRQPKFKLTPVVGATFAFLAALGVSSSVMAGPGFVTATKNTGATFRLQTYFANSPAGVRDNAVPEAVSKGATADTGTALRKFVDTLPLLGASNASSLSGDPATVKYLPEAVASKWVSPEGAVTSDDYIELAVVEYLERFHSDLANKTTLRGFVQIDVDASNGRTSVIAGSKQLPLIDAQGHALTILATDANGKLQKDGNGQYIKVPALAVDDPHYLGPVVRASSGVPMRIKLHNLLPAGRAVVTGAGDAAVISQRNGDHFLPLDETMLGAGVGPDQVTRYTQNRINLHVQGADAPWISAGSPHQWFTPAAEADASLPGSLAHTFATNAALDPTYLNEYLRGVSQVNVPDMNDPGPGAATYYFANNQGARMLWASDRTLGQSRQNVLAGMAFPYIITDASETAMVSDGTLPPAARTLPLILQDRTFVPKDIKLQDGKWNISAWGGEGSLWMPHVYEYLSDPAFQNSWNPVGRWAYGPTFWPIFPAQYALPSGSYGDPSFTPEAFFDTAVVNGVAYPTTEVEPTTYRLRIVNASNDRWMTFNLFESKVTAQLADGTPVTNPLGIESEVDMVQATAPLPADACADGQTRPTLNASGVWCTPTTWPIDSRAGGVAAPSAVGPSLLQVANEAGWLAQVPTIDPTPIFYSIDKGRIIVLNPDTPALFLAPGEVADVVVDFSQYAGKSLVAYNDAGGPEPGADPRNFYFTGVGDQSSTGGAEDTKPGYGPNVTTLMRFKVKAAPAGTVPAAFDPKPLVDAVAATYYGLGGQDRPIVAQPEYSTFDSTWAGILPGPAVDGVPVSYADIYTGSLKSPRFTFVPGDPSTAFNSIKVLAGGSGYVTAPAVNLSGDGSGAVAVASLKITGAQFASIGSGYTSAPTVTIGTPASGGGSGAVANALLKPNAVKMAAGGSGYTQAAVDAAIAAGSFATFTAPQTAGGARPTVSSATVSVGGQITAITLNLDGGGYSVVPSMSITGGGGTGARGTVTAGVGGLVFNPAYPTTPSSAGGGGYTDLSSVAVTFAGGGVNVVAPTVALTGSVFDIAIVDNGAGYTGAPSVQIGASPTNDNASAKADIELGSALGSLLPKTKSIQELFEPGFARYNSTQGVELPYTGATTQTTVPLGFVDTPTELINEGDVQIWKYTHNGLFGQPVEFAGFNVQVVNRVGWDGFAYAPLANEFGWKSVVRMLPLEDAVVALKPKRVKLPGFGLPTSVRLMDPTQPWGAIAGFTQFDPATGLAATIVNDYVDFRWENTVSNTVASRAALDFNRPVIFNAKDKLPLAPADVAALSDGNGLTVSWTDASPLGVDSPAAEVGFRVQVGQVGSNAWVDLQSDLRYVNGLPGSINALANATRYVDRTVQDAPPPPTPNAPAGAADAPRSVTISWVVPNNAPAAVTGFRVLRARVAQDGVALGVFVDLGVLLPPNALSFTDLGVEPVAAYQYEVVAVGSNAGQVVYRVVAVNAVGESPSAPSAPVATSGHAQEATSQASASIVTPIAAPTLPSPDIALNLAAGIYHAVFNFNAVDGAASYMVRYRVGNNANNGAWTAWANQTALSKEVTLNQGQYITFQVYAISANRVNNLVVNSATVTSNTVREAIPTVPNGLAVSALTASSLTLSWAGTTDATYTIQRSTNAAFTQNLVSTPSNGTATSLQISGLDANTRYYFRVMASNGLGNSAYSGASNTWTLANPVTTAPVASAVTANALTLSWTAAAGPAAPSNYTVQRATNAAFTAGLVNTTVAGNLTTTTLNGLVANTTYYFRVLSVNGANVQSAASPSVTQLTVPATPAAPAIGAGTVTSTGLTLNWTAVAGLGYQVQVATDAAFASASVLAAGPFASTAGTLAVSGLQGNTRYWFRVVALNAAGTSTPSNAVNTWTLADAVAAAPTVANLAATSMTLNWLAPANGGAASYIVQRATNAAFTAGLVNTTVNGAVALVVNGLNANTAYYFRVVARNGANVQAAASPVLSQLTLPGAPANVIQVRGVGGGVVEGGLSWSTVAGFTYELRWADANTMAGAQLVSPASSGQLIDVGGIARRVFMQVRAVNASGPGAWSAVTAVGAR